MRGFAVLKVSLVILIALTVLALVWYALLARKPVPERYTYGVSFNTPYARELGLDWEAVYTAILEELPFERVRLAAHWTMVEPTQGEYNFSELDRQIALAREHDVQVVLGVGRRLPRWPECHVPQWAEGLTWEEQKEHLREYIRAVVTRYKDESHIIYWQVENEPFLTVFAYEHCGALDVDFLDEEIALVRSLDPATPILITDSGNLGPWFGAYKRGDAFGTSAYLYLWNPELGPIKSRLPPSWYRAKHGLMKLLYGDKEAFLIELSAEPWLTEPIADVSLATQFERMDMEKFEEILTYGKATRFPDQYLWGAEWWYWLREQGHPEFWERVKGLE